MKATKRKTKILFSLFSAFVAILLSIGMVAPEAAAAAQGAQPPSPYVTVQTAAQADGTMISDTIISGPPTPPPGSEAQRAPVQMLAAAAKILSVPAFRWVNGCSSVSGAMIAGYYDRNGYPNMYTGPTAGGVMPLTDASWPMWSDGTQSYPSNPLIASKMGVDGRTTYGSINDYWVQYQSTAQDPYITGPWTQHAWGTAIGDYMKTSQSAYNNTDGSTHFFNYLNAGLPSPTKMLCTSMPTLSVPGGFSVAQVDGTYGRKLFYEARGYSVTDCFNQNTDNNAAGGFSLANYRAEIDAGRPVLLNLDGHSIAGVGYDSASNTIYVHDTWDTLDHAMPWGGSYSGMKLLSVSVVNLAPPSVATGLTPAGTIIDTTPTYSWTKLAGVTQYQYTLFQGITPIYTKGMLATNCGASTCTNTPTNVLPLGAYMWKVRALAGGVWKPWSTGKAFTLVAPTAGFNSQFNGSAAGWVKRPGAAWAIGPANYWTNGLSAYTSSVSYNANFTNFTYQARLKRVANYSDGEAGLVVRGTPMFDAANDWTKGYYFSISSWGDFAVVKIVNGSWTAIKNWTLSPSVVSGGWNTLKVVASGSSLRFYINGTLVWTGTDAGIASGQVGVYSWDAGGATERIDIDWATLTLSTADAAALSTEPIESGQMPSPYAHPMRPSQ